VVSDNTWRHFLDLNQRSSFLFLIKVGVRVRTALLGFIWLSSVQPLQKKLPDPPSNPNFTVVTWLKDVLAPIQSHARCCRMYGLMVLSPPLWCRRRRCSCSLQKMHITYPSLLCSTQLTQSSTVSQPNASYWCMAWKDATLILPLSFDSFPYRLRYTALALLSTVPAFLQPKSFWDIWVLSDSTSRVAPTLPFALVPSPLAPVIVKTHPLLHQEMNLTHNSFFFQISRSPQRNWHFPGPLPSPLWSVQTSLPLSQPSFILLSMQDKTEG